MRVKGRALVAVRRRRNSLSVQGAPQGVNCRCNPRTKRRIMSAPEYRTKHSSAARKDGKAVHEGIKMKDQKSMLNVAAHEIRNDGSALGRLLIGRRFDGDSSGRRLRFLRRQRLCGGLPRQDDGLCQNRVHAFSGCVDAGDSLLQTALRKGLFEVAAANDAKGMSCLYRFSAIRTIHNNHLEAF